MVNIDDMRPSDWCINRELSWLEFNDRVLREGMRPETPLLERVKFLAIVASNLDEFFMVRVGGLSQAVRAGAESLDPSGMTPRMQLHAISERARRMAADHASAIHEALDAMKEHGIAIVSPSEWSHEQRSFLEQYFDEDIAPLLTPLAIGRYGAKSLLPALRLHVAARLTPLGDANPEEEGLADADIVVVPAPTNLKRLVSVPSAEGVHLTLLDDIIREFVGRLVPDRRVEATMTFRVTRDSDVAVDEDETDDLLQNIETVLSERNRRQVVRFEVSQTPDEALLDYLSRYFECSEEETYEVDGILDATALFGLTSLSGFSHLKDEDWPPQPVADLRGCEDLFETLRERDVLISLPYEQFDPVVQLVQQASIDPQTLAIRMVLYRTGEGSPITAALMEAARRGKQVTVLVELKARFDEARNVGWARKLEDAGCDVIYGIAGYKTHAKVLLILRREEHGIRRYAHLATGNYNEKTAKIYSDVGVMTSDEEITADALAFTNLLTGFSQPVGWNRMSISPMGIRQTIEQMIEREIQLSDKQQPGRIIAKMNALQCPRLIRSLYRASQAGVQIDLNIRGVCCLRPGIEGLSENIRVTSIIDRYLEHARIFYFAGGGRDDVYLASADWMVRNLDKRLETMTPVVDPRLKRRLISMLELYASDNVKSWQLRQDGTYVPAPADGESVRAQELLHRMAVDAAQNVPQDQLQFRPRRKQRDE